MMFHLFLQIMIILSSSLHILQCYRHFRPITSINKPVSKLFEIYLTTISNIPSKGDNFGDIIKLTPTIVKTIKLPIWPIIGGILTQIADFLPNKIFAEKIWTSIGGRVVPMTLADENVSPFLLLAHHTHSFTPFDPFRVLTKLIMPEGFPAHPHAGFDTITYCIDGGFLHRDSEGCKMRYGNGEVQWMRAARGILHEEMWDLSDSQWTHKYIEIFQLWVNLPEKSKSDSPIVKVLSREEIPLIELGSKDSVCRVISGSVQFEIDSVNRNRNDRDVVEGGGNVIAASPVSILHLSLEAHKKIRIQVEETDQSVVLYVRRGCLLLNSIDDNGGDGNEDTSKNNIVNIGDYVKYSQSESIHSNMMDTMEKTKRGEFEILASDRGLDCLLLIGTPIKEPVIWRGPFVQSSVQKFQEKAEAFGNAKTQLSWDYQLSDEEWLKHCKNINLQEKLT